MELCVTGGIACGKTQTGRYLAGRGFTIIEADKIAHELMRKGTSLYHALIEEFSAKIINSAGEISRQTLGQIVFSDQNRLARLNTLVHPLVRAEIEKFRSSLKGPMVAIIPLVYEVGWGDDWDKIICVAASISFQMARLKERGLTAREARLRLLAQMNVTEKMHRADYVIYNSGSLDLLEQQANLILTRFLP